ncbi:Holliday junction resolvase [Candidatus Woesearchaeota archaeon]|nr:Holliday junction resolvase [Candidatus Woesearchaeota archaeon]
MNTKQKGTTAERDLIHMLQDANWAAFRAAGSGSSRYPCPDIIAGNSMRKVAIEVKATKEKRKYFPKQEIEDLKTFAFQFGSEAWVGIKFQGKGWFFFSLEDLKETKGGFSIGLDDAQLKGFTFDELVKS